MNKFFRSKFFQAISLLIKGLVFNQILEHVEIYGLSESQWQTS